MIKTDHSALHVIAIGEPMIELSALDTSAGTAALGFAGDTLNTAVYLARAFARSGATVEYLTVLGRDTLSEAMTAWMADEGIGTARIARHPTRLPGIYAIELSETGERSFLYWREASAARTLFDEGPAAEEVLRSAPIIYLSGITLAILTDAARAALISACHRAKADGRMVVFDSNYRPRLWQSADTARQTFNAMWAATTHGLPSADDEALLHRDTTPEETLRRIAALGVSEIALKQGAAGPVLWSEGRVLRPDTTPASNVVDTTAAGDSFNAGYLHARLTGAVPVAASLAGHALACKVIGHKGAILPRGA